MELNLQELKDLAKDGVSEKKIHVISEKRNHLVASFEAILQNMEEALSLDQGARRRPVERNISDLIELSNLESKLDEMQNLGVLSGFQLDTIRKKMYKLKEQKKKLISKWEKHFLKEYPEGYIPELPKSILRTTGKQRVGLVEPSDQLTLRPQLPGLQIHISKVPVANRIKPVSKTVDAGYDTTVQEEQDQLLKRDIELAIKGRLLEEFSGSKVSLPQLDSSTYLHTDSKRLALEAAMQEILEFNKNLLPSHRTNLQQALNLASYQLQQKQLQQQHQANVLVEKFRNMPIFLPQPPGTARFQDYTIPVQKSGWETNQLPQKDYFQKLALLKRKILGPEMKGGGTSPVTQGNIQDQVEDPIAISGKGCNPYRKETTFPVIRQSSKHK